jgi:hypothetical protein
MRPTRFTSYPLSELFLFNNALKVIISGDTAPMPRTTLTESSLELLNMTRVLKNLSSGQQDIGTCET